MSRIWDPRIRQDAQDVKQSISENMYVDLSHDGQLSVLIKTDDTVQVWDIGMEQEVQTLKSQSYGL